MGRKRINLGNDAPDKIRALLDRGMKANAIAQQLGISPATAKRRIQELKGKAPAVSPGFASTPAPLAPAPPPPPSSDPVAPALDDELEAAEVPEGASVAQINEWLEVAKERAQVAAEKNDVDNHVKYLRVAAFLLEARRKAMPVPKVDYNAHPDMIEAAQSARERLHKLAESLVRVSSSPLAETIGRLLRSPRE